MEIREISSFLYWVWKDKKFVYVFPAIFWISIYFDEKTKFSLVLAIISGIMAIFYLVRYFKFYNLVKSKKMVDLRNPKFSLYRITKEGQKSLSLIMICLSSITLLLFSIAYFILRGYLAYAIILIFGFGLIVHMSIKYNLAYAVKRIVKERKRKKAKRNH